MPSREPGAALLCALLLVASCTPGSLIDLSHNRQLHLALGLFCHRPSAVPTRRFNVGPGLCQHGFDGFSL